MVFTPWDNWIVSLTIDFPYASMTRIIWQRLLFSQQHDIILSFFEGNWVRNLLTDAPNIAEILLEYDNSESSLSHSRSCSFIFPQWSVQSCVIDMTLYVKTLISLCRGTEYCTAKQSKTKNCTKSTKAQNMKYVERTAYPFRSLPYSSVRGTVWPAYWITVCFQSDCIYCHIQPRLSIHIWRERL